MSILSNRKTLIYNLIAVSKLATATLLALAGLGMFRLLGPDVGDTLEHYATRLHLDPENRFVHQVIEKIGGISPRRMHQLAFGTFFYAALELTEGVGLLLHRRWAEYLTILATALLLPLEINELRAKISVIRVLILVINLAILAYLIVRLRSRNEEPPVPESVPA